MILLLNCTSRDSKREKSHWKSQFSNYDGECLVAHHTHAVLLFLIMNEKSSLSHHTIYTSWHCRLSLQSRLSLRAPRTRKKFSLAKAYCSTHLFFHCRCERTERITGSRIISASTLSSPTLHLCLYNHTEKIGYLRQVESTRCGRELHLISRPIGIPPCGKKTIFFNQIHLICKRISIIMRNQSIFQFHFIGIYTIGM